MHLKLCNFGKYAGDKVSLPPKEEPKPDVDKRISYYRRISAILVILCILLLTVVLALSLKLSEAQSSQQCTERVKETTISREMCHTLYPVQDSQHNGGGHVCSDCGKGWLEFEDSCYFLSTKRLDWQESREECKKFGGDLAIISNGRVQSFLTKKAHLLYWIGLSHKNTEQWTWINNDTVSHNYWAISPADGHCALLSGMSSGNNWYSNPCIFYSHFICQKVK